MILILQSETEYFRSSHFHKLAYCFNTIAWIQHPGERPAFITKHSLSKAVGLKTEYCVHQAPGTNDTSYDVDPFDYSGSGGMALHVTVNTQTLLQSISLLTDSLMLISLVIKYRL